MEILLQLDDEPHCPVGYVVSVAVIRRIAHGQHAGVYVLEALGQQEVFYEVLLEACMACQIECHAGREVAVAEPSGAFARGRVHEYVEGALAVCFAGRLEEAVKVGVRRREGSAVYVGVAVVAHVYAVDAAAARLEYRLGILHGVGLEALETVLSGLEFVRNVCLTSETSDVDMPVGREQLVERYLQTRRLRHLDLDAEEAAAVAVELVYAALYGFGLMHAVVGVCDAALEQLLCGLLGKGDGRGRGGIPCGVACPRVEVGREDIVFGEGALEAESGHVGLALAQLVCRELLSRGGDALAVKLDLGLQERGLVEKVVARLVVPGHLDGDDVVAAVHVWSYVVAVDAVEVVGGDAGAVRHELAVDTQTVVRRGGYAYVCRGGAAGVYGLAERECEVLLGLASLGPYGACRYEAVDGRGVGCDVCAASCRRGRNDGNRDCCNDSLHRVVWVVAV